MARKSSVQRADSAEELMELLGQERAPEKPRELKQPEERAEDNSGGFFGMGSTPEEVLTDRTRLEFLGDVPPREAGPVQLAYMQGLVLGVPEWVQAVRAYLEVSGVRGGRSVDRIKEVAKSRSKGHGGGRAGRAGVSVPPPGEGTTPSETAEELEDVDVSDETRESWLAGWGLD